MKHLIISVAIILMHCGNANKEPAYSYNYDNHYNLPNEIITYLKLNAFNECVDFYKDFLFQKNISLSTEAIESVCKNASIGIPYKQFWLRDIPLCSLVCGKPAEYYYDSSIYQWIVPILIDSLTIVEMSYVKDLPKPRNKNYSGKLAIVSDSIWTWLGSGMVYNRYCALKTCNEKYHKIPVFIGYSPYGGDLFTIPGHENEIFGQIFNTDNIEDARLKCIKPENPCEVLSFARAIIEKDNNYNKPHQAIVPLPDRYKQYKKEIYKSK